MANYVTQCFGPPPWVYNAIVELASIPMANEHLIYNATGQGEKLNNLRGEYFDIPSSLRRKWIRKAIQREVTLRLTGQKLFQHARIPEGNIKLLWFYDWNTLGDSIMDLSQRFAFPDRITLDICMPSGPAEIFAGDLRFHRIYTRIDECPRDYDFILLHDISSTSIRVKLTRYFFKPWASMINHQQGEQYARVNFASARLEQLLNRPLKPIRPRLPQSPDVHPEQNRIAVSLGGVDARRRYLSWPQLLQAIADKVKPDQMPRFALMGSGDTAHQDLNGFSPEFLSRYADVEVDQPNLSALKAAVGRCAYFIGCDSGIMHLAEALDKPGLALFGHIKPEWRLLPESRLEPRFDPETVNNMNPNDVAADFVRVYEKGSV